jgi:hypothetical protein
MTGDRRSAPYRIGSLAEDIARLERQKLRRGLLVRAGRHDQQALAGMVARAGAGPRGAARPATKRRRAMKPLAKLGEIRALDFAALVKDAILFVEGGGLPRPITRPLKGLDHRHFVGDLRRYCRTLDEMAQATRDRGDDGPDDRGSRP